MIKINSDKIDPNELKKKVEKIVQDYESLDKEFFIQEQMLNNQHLLRATLSLRDTKKFKMIKFVQKVLLIARLDFLEAYARKLYKNFSSPNQNAFIIENFLPYEDKDFIQVAYKTILSRDVKPAELNNYLPLLRSGTLSKTEILAAIRYSDEGKQKDVNILGLAKRNFILKLFKIPFIGKILNILMLIVKLPNTLARVRLLESNLYLLNQESDKKTAELFTLSSSNKQDIVNLEVNLQNEVEDLSQKNLLLENQILNLFQKNLLLENQLQNYIDDLILTKRYIASTQKDIQNLISLSKEEVNIQNKPLMQELLALQNKQLESFYIAFENKFRGSRKDIKKRQSYYLSYIQKVIQTPLDEVLDVGCGRGEFLELLQDNNIEAKGVDLNSLMVEETLSLDLKATFQDAIIYLKSLKDESLSVVSGFHIVEHLPFEVLVTLFDESLRTLKKGGMIIFETPNPENIFVGACSFYTDPTHLNPIPPSTLQFLAQNRGFKDVEIHRLHPVKSPIYPDIPNADDVNTLIFASTKEQDYSIIGYK